ncbi:hypothetical protein CRUP_015610 [Coryphaenoides rupestris]|nr:hypothetical protein CRUP_015610 [Coryphaenoides rupestris]
MGSFKGHALPGSFFVIGALWWTGKFSFWHATRRNKTLGSGRLASRSAQRRLEVLEAAIMLFFSVVGMLAEQFAANGPRLHLYDAPESRWKDLMNWQHTTMYLFFSLASGASLASCICSSNPCFLFLYHLHGRSMLDVHVHQMLLYAVFGQTLVVFLEVFHRGNVSLELLRSALCLLQGSWFWQIGYVLYPPSGVQWDLTDHNNMMFVTMCFCWHLAASMLTVGALYCATSCAVRSRLKRTPPLEMGLLKPRDRELESDDETM